MKEKILQVPVPAKAQFIENIHGSKYTLKCTPIRNIPESKRADLGTAIDQHVEYWDYTLVEIYDNAKTKLGQYTYNYHGVHKTFFPFTQNGKDYALYAEDYTSTSVMSLPDCKKLASETPNQFGFCPVEFYVPPNDETQGIKGDFGFVSGCVWGDDTSWKIQFLDLSKIEQGVLVRDDRFGYIEQPSKPLSECIDLREFDVSDDDPEDHSHTVVISCAKWFNLLENENVKKDTVEKA